MSFVNYLKLLIRKRRVDVAENETLFNRCLPTIDITLLGIGSMLGAGLYVATGEIACNTAGPAIVISLLIAAIPAILSSLCYAEFGVRLSRTGSSYAYCYYSLGEIWAFTVGWQLLLENSIAGGLMAHTISQFVDTICGKQISMFFESHLANWHVNGFLPHPDFLACAFAFFFTILNASGTRHSALFIRCATIVNLLAILFVILAGFLFMNPDNWSSSEKFAPYGFGGILNGAALSYFAFLGFDILNNASEEVKHPKRSVPFAGTASTYIGVLVYLVTAAMITLIIPYSKMTRNISLPQALEQQGFEATKYVVAIGGVFALSTAFLAYNFSASRILYAMSNDRLLCPLLEKISASNRVPIRAVVACGLASSCACLFLDFYGMVEIISIGTLLAYAAISAAVLLERYRPADESSEVVDPDEENEDENANPNCFEKLLDRQNNSEFNVGRTFPETPTAETHRLASIGVACLVFAGFGLTLCIYPLKGLEFLRDHQPWVIVAAILTGLIFVSATALLFLLPRSTPTFKHVVPCVPVTPLISISINVYLLGSLSAYTWAIFAAWTFMGMVIYFMYGIHHSRAQEENRTDSSVFLLQYDDEPQTTYTRPRISPSIDEGPEKSSSESGADDEGFLSNAITTDDEGRSPLHSVKRNQEVEEKT